MRNDENTIALWEHLKILYARTTELRDALDEAVEHYNRQGWISGWVREATDALNNQLRGYVHGLNDEFERVEKCLANPFLLRRAKKEEELEEFFDRESPLLSETIADVQDGIEGLLKVIGNEPFDGDAFSRLYYKFGNHVKALWLSLQELEMAPIVTNKLIQEGRAKLRRVHSELRQAQLADKPSTVRQESRALTQHGETSQGVDPAKVVRALAYSKSNPGCTQRALADHLELDHGTVRKWYIPVLDAKGVTRGETGRGLYYHSIM